jgi:predicted Zn-dependent protease
VPKSKPKPKTKPTKARTKPKKAPARAKAGPKATKKKPRAASESNDVLVLIAEQSFPRAMTLIAASPTAALALTEPAPVFNYAAALWGREGVPSVPLFKRAFELASASQWDSDNAESANFHQCLALAAAVAGDRAVARSALEKSRRFAGRLGAAKEFSGWRYRDVRRGEFLKDLEAMERLLEDPSTVPAFVSKSD